MKCGEYKLNIGSGRRVFDEEDICIDSLDFSKEHKHFVKADLEEAHLPFCDSSCVSIAARNILEHIHNLIPLLNECHRVLRADGEMYIEVPFWASKKAYQDPTHCRFFDEYTFNHYFTDGHYGILKWKIKKMRRKLKHNDIICVIMSPVK